jgi:hypothetical protein
MRETSKYYKKKIEGKREISEIIIIKINKRRP